MAAIALGELGPLSRSVLEFRLQLLQISAWIR